MPENDETEDFSLSYSDRNRINRAVAESTSSEYQIFTDIIEKGKLAGTLNNCSVSDYECMLSRDEYDEFISNLKNGGYFASQPVEVILGKKTIYRRKTAKYVFLKQRLNQKTEI